MSVQQQFESILEAHIPTNVALTLNDDGTASAFVKRGDGEMHAVTIPEQIAEQGPQACLSYVADLSMEELRRELEDG